MKEILQAIKNFLNDRFNLDEDKADEAIIIENINREVEFKGTNLWALIFAIFIASIGLNVNSTAVIIGAMLVSPLMGPIMGIGLGIGITDFDLVKRGIKNLLIAAIISVATSAFYFFITPLHEARSELLARTTPSLWDVLIAFFGGLAGIVAGTRKYKSNVIPGVAIATALMPPLCTAGFGLATGHMFYFLGAIYLFFINSLFICIATFIIVRYLKFHKKVFNDERVQKRVTRYIVIVVAVTVLPSIYLAYRIVDKSFFETNARNFVQNEFKFKRTQVITRTFNYKPPRNTIDLLLMGEDLSQPEIDSLKNKMQKYKLTHTDLVIHQGLNAKQEIDFSQIKASILEDVFKQQMEKDTMPPKPLSKLEKPIPNLKEELRSLYPELKEYSLTNAVINDIDSTRSDTVTICICKFSKNLPRKERMKLNKWLANRIQADSLKLIIE
jgi:uncharacterized hydrophobic protein (TIGR00271 family)